MGVCAVFNVWLWFYYCIFVVKVIVFFSIIVLQFSICVLAHIYYYLEGLRGVLYLLQLSNTLGCSNRRSGMGSDCIHQSHRLKVTVCLLVVFWLIMVAKLLIKIDWHVW